MPTSVQRSPSHSPTHRSSSASCSPSHSPDNSPSPSPSPERPLSPVLQYPQETPNKRTRSKTRVREGGDTMSSDNPLKRKAHPDEDTSPRAPTSPHLVPELEEDDTPDLHEPDEDVKPTVAHEDHDDDDPDPDDAAHDDVVVNDEYADGRVACPHCGMRVSIRDDGGSGNTLDHWDAHRRTCTAAQSAAPTPSTSRRRPDGDAVSFASGPPPKRRRAKRTEAERIDYLRNDPYVRTFEPYRVLCASCDKWIRLRPNSTYCSIPWDAHRKSCLGKRINNKNVYDFDRRNETFSKDPDIRKFDPERLLCNRCDKWIPVPADEHKLALEKWHAHKTSCVARGQGMVISGPGGMRGEGSSSRAGPSRPHDPGPRPVASPIASTSSSPRMHAPPPTASTSRLPGSSSHSPIPRATAAVYPMGSTATPSHPSHLSLSHAPHASHPHASSSSSSFHDLTPTTFTPTYESRRRNAEQRAATLRADKLITLVEPNRVFCSLCKKWVQLRQDSTYCAYPWVQHRTKCVARFQRRSEKSVHSRMPKHGSASSSSARPRWEAHVPHMMDTAMPLDMEGYEDEEEDELLSGDSDEGGAREMGREGDVEMSDSSSEEEVAGSAGEGDEGEEDDDDDDVESEEGVESKPAVPRVGVRMKGKPTPREGDVDKGKEKEKDEDKAKERKHEKSKSKGKEPSTKTASSRRRTTTTTATKSFSSMPPPHPSLSRASDGFMQHHRAERGGYREIQHPHLHGSSSHHPYPPHPHPHSHHPHPHPHPHAHHHSSSSGVTMYPYRTPPPGPQSSTNAPIAQSTTRYPHGYPHAHAHTQSFPHPSSFPHPHAPSTSSTHAKSRSMPYPSSSSSAAAASASAHHSTSTRRNTDSATRHPAAGTSSSGYRHVQAPVHNSRTSPSSSSHGVHNTSSGRARAAHHPHSYGHARPSHDHTHPHTHTHGHTHAHPTTHHAHHAHGVHHPHRPTLETDGLVEIKPEVHSEELGRDAGGGAGEGDGEGDADADGEVDPGVDEDEDGGGISGGGGGGGATSVGAGTGVVGTNGGAERTRSSGSMRPGSNGGGSRRRVFDLNNPTERISFITTSISHLFTTTYAPTDDLSIASLVAYVNAALPPDRYDDFDTREVSRAAIGLKERGEILYEGDIIKLVGRE